jgi:uncharacterized protein (TIGR03435 family)
MADANDMELMRQYADDNSENAFTELVQRHINLVYSVAWRYVGNPPDAQDVTQAVFVIFNKKISGLRNRATLTGWLYETTRLTSRQFLRTRGRQQSREQEAYMQSVLQQPDNEIVWRQVAPVLEEAMARLSEKERALLALRFFENKTISETAALLGIAEWAARKRATRAVEKLQKFFSKRGVSCTAQAITGAISAYALQPAPFGLTKTISAVAIAKGAAASASTLTLVKGALRFMIWNKVKYAALVGAIVLLASGTAVIKVETTRAAAERSEANALIDECEKFFDSGRRGIDLMDSVSKVMKSHQGIAYIRINQAPFGDFFGGEASGMTVKEGHVQIGAYLGEVLRDVYDLGPQFPQHRIIVPPDLIYARYDIVNTMGSGGLAALQRQLKEQFGIVAGHEKRKNLLLILHDPAAPKLHPHNRGEIGAGYTVENVTMPELAGYLTRFLGVKVTDQTGLHGSFDYNIDTPASPTPDEMKKIFSNQLGLDLVPASDNEETDFLVAQEVGPQKHP